MLLQIEVNKYSFVAVFIIIAIIDNSLIQPATNVTSKFILNHNFSNDVNSFILFSLRFMVGFMTLIGLSYILRMWLSHKSNKELEEARISLGRNREGDVQAMIVGSPYFETPMFAIPRNLITNSPVKRLIGLPGTVIDSCNMVREFTRQHYDFQDIIVDGKLKRVDLLARLRGFLSNKYKTSIIYYTGHGDLNGNLVAHDSVIKPEDIPLNENKGKIVIILDSCFSGLFAKNLEKLPRFDKKRMKVIFANYGTTDEDPDRGGLETYKMIGYSLPYFLSSNEILINLSTMERDEHPGNIG